MKYKDKVDYTIQLNRDEIKRIIYMLMREESYWDEMREVTESRTADEIVCGQIARKLTKQTGIVATYRSPVDEKDHSSDSG